jgi:hypothetical protein
MMNAWLDGRSAAQAQGPWDTAPYHAGGKGEVRLTVVFNNVPQRPLLTIGWATACFRRTWGEDFVPGGLGARIEVASV